MLFLVSVPAPVVRTRFCSSGGQFHQPFLRGFAEGKAPLFKTLIAIVSFLERDGGSTNLLQVFEDAPKNLLFFHCPVAPLCDAVGLRFSDEGVVRGDAPAPDLVAKIVRSVLHVRFTDIVSLLALPFRCCVRRWRRS